MKRPVPVTEETASGGDPAFDALRELTRSGYVPEPGGAAEDGILLRHASAPDLVLHRDGRVEVPVGQAPKKRGRPLPPDAPPGMSWRRTIAIVLLVALIWVLSTVLTVTFLEMQ